MVRASEAIDIIKLVAKFSNKPLIVSAGMPRSGSTLLFNILREILIRKWGSLSSGWYGDIADLDKGNAYLIKLHNLNWYYRVRANQKFYTYRDVRVAAVSSLHKFNKEPSIDDIRTNINQYLIAKSSCDLMIKYEELVSDPFVHVSKIIDVLEVQVDIDEIIESSFNLNPPDSGSSTYSKETLLHKGHFTYTNDDEWRSVLSEELQVCLRKEFDWWFEECGYSVD